MKKKCEELRRELEQLQAEFDKFKEDYRHAANEEILKENETLADFWERDSTELQRARKVAERVLGKWVHGTKNSVPPMDEIVAKIIAQRENGAECKRLHDAVVKYLSAKGHDLCHENRQELAQAFGIEPNDLTQGLPPESEFAVRCVEYRKQLYGCDGPGSELEVYQAECQRLQNEILGNRKRLEWLEEIIFDDEGIMFNICRDVVSGGDLIEAIDQRMPSA